MSYNIPYDAQVAISAPPIDPSMLASISTSEASLIIAIPVLAIMLIALLADILGGDCHDDD